MSVSDFAFLRKITDVFPRENGGSLAAPVPIVAGMAVYPAPASEPDADGWESF
jgi:hypothetical protein